MSLKWERPPPRTGSTDWEVVAEELRKRPAEWALVIEEAKTPYSAASLAYQLRNGLRAGMSKGEFEATARGLSVYARYVGGAS